MFCIVLVLGKDMRGRSLLYVMGAIYLKRLWILIRHFLSSFDALMIILLAPWFRL